MSNPLYFRAQRDAPFIRVRGVLSRIFLVQILASILCARSAMAQDASTRNVIVEAEELPTAYGAPPDLSHGRISTLTKSYVLSPFGFELEAGYEGAVFRHGLPTQLFGQEIEMGLPARLPIGTSFHSIPLSPPNISLASATHCPIRE